MAIPTITKMQKTAQQMLDTYKKQQTASTAATQSGSTSTPTVSSTPKVTQTQKAKPSVQQTSSVPGTQATTQVSNLQSINLFKPQEQAKTVQQMSQQYKNLLGGKDTTSSTIPGSVISAANTVGGDAETQVKKTITQQFSDWIKGVDTKMKESSENLQDKLWEGGVGQFWLNLIHGETQAEKYIATLTDKLAGKGNEGYLDAVKKSYGDFWDTEYKQYEQQQEQIMAAESDGTFWGDVKTTLKHPELFFGNVGYMLPSIALAAGGAPGAGAGFTMSEMSEDVYEDYSTDKEITDKYNDNQIFIISSGVGTVLGLIEYVGEFLGEMPGMSKLFKKTISNIGKKEVEKTLEKGFEKELEGALEKTVKKEFKNPIKNALLKWFKGSAGEFVEEPLQNEIQNEVAIGLGSNREHYTVSQLLTQGTIAGIYGGIMEGTWAPINIKQNLDLQESYKEFVKQIDSVAPGLKDEVKENMFAAIVAAQIRDGQLGDRKVNSLQNRSLSLYNEKANLEQELQTTTDEQRKVYINNRISDIDNKINNIDKRLNQWQNTVDQVNSYVQEQQAQQQQVMPKESGGENLSEQTMEDVTVTDNNRLKELNKIGKKDLNPFGGNTQDFFSLLDKVSKMKPEKAVAEFLKYNKDSISKMKEALTNYVTNSIKNGGGTRMALEDAKYVLEQVTNAEQKIDELINEKNEIENRIKEEEEKKKAEEKKNQKDIKDMTFDEYRDAYEASYIASDEDISDALRDYTLLKVDSELSKHLIGFTNQDIRDIKNNLTDEQIKKINEMFAMISSTLGIDFNLVVKDRKFGLSVTDEFVPGKSVWTNGVMMRKDKKFLGKLLDAGVIITLKNGEVEAASTLAHELSHLVDVTWAFEHLSQPTYVSGKYKEYYSLLGDGKKLDSKRDTYKFTKWARKNKIKQTRKFMKYRHEPTEVRARYNQQYMAYINDKELFNKMADENLFDAAGKINDNAKFRTKEEFEKLLPAFYDIYENQLAGYRISEKNSIYYDAMVMLNKMRDNKLEVINKTEELDRIEKQYPNQTSKILNTIFDLEAQYLEALDMVERMEGDIGEDMRKEYEAELSTLYSNFQMLIEKEEQYIEIQRETIEQQIQQDLMGEQPETMIDIKKESDDENDIEKIEDESSQEIEDEGELETEQGGEPETTVQVVKDAFSKQTRGTEKQKKAFKIMDTQIGQAVKDVITPAISRLYSINPRIAGRVIQMETQRDINIHRYRERAKPFVEAISKLDDKAKLEVKKALLDFGALASEIAEQGPEALNNYKQQQTQKIKDIFNKNGIDEKAATDMFNVLNELGQKYKDAGLAINLTDMYFPRTVINYEGLSEYISEITGLPQKETDGLVKRIAKISRNENMTDVEKEAEIRGLLTRDFRTPSTTSKYGKNRLLGELAAWDDGTNRIWSYYADPMESLDNYIVNMENAIQRQLLLGGLQEDAGLRGENVSLSEIVEGLVEQDKISESQLKEAKKTLLSILDKKPSLKIVTTAKNITYIATLTNFISAVNQLDDLGMTIIRNKSGLKNIVKTIFKKADIKYTDLGLEDSYEMFRGQGKITNWLFKKSGFNALDRLGKTSFINTAWDSLISQAEKRPDGSDTKTRKYLMSRLEQMYGKETMEHMMEKIDSKNYMTDGQIDIDILTDLLYQLGSTQPLYTSAMPTAYLNNPWIRLCYALQSFTIKRIDWLIQGTKEVNKKHGPVAAGAWLMGVSVFLAAFGVAIGDLQDLIKGEEEETVLWKIINEGINEALNEVRKEGKASWLKIWNVSLYDKKTYKWQGGWGVFMSKMKPAILGIGKNFLEAVTEHNEDEMTDLIQYIPIIGKFLYYRFFAEIESSTSSKYSVGGKIGGNKGSSGGKYSVGGKLK